MHVFVFSGRGPMFHPRFHHSARPCTLTNLMVKQLALCDSIYAKLTGPET